MHEGYLVSLGAILPNLSSPYILTEVGHFHGQRRNGDLDAYPCGHQILPSRHRRSGDTGPHPGGTPRFRREISVTVICMDHTREADEVLEWCQGDPFPSARLRQVWDTSWDQEMAEGERGPQRHFDIANIHNFHSPQALMASYYCHKQGLPYVFTTHYHGHGQTLVRDLLFRVYRVFGANIYRWSEKNICVSNFEKELVQKDFHLPEDKIAIVPNGGRDFPAVDVQREGSILYVGRLVKYKGVDHVLKAMAILKTRGMTVRLRIVGTGPEKERTGQYCARAGAGRAGRLAGGHQRGAAEHRVPAGRRTGTAVRIGGLRSRGGRGAEVRNTMHRGEDICAHRVHVRTRMPGGRISA